MAEQNQIELDFPEGVVRFPFEPQEKPRLFWHIAREVIPVADTLTEMGKAIAKHFGRTVSCKAGCGACCRQMVPLSPPEAAIIADAVDRLPPARKKEVLSAFDRGLAKLADAGIKDAISTIYSVTTDKNKVLEINRAYFELDISCPFLLEGSCGIYPQRPSRCREYSVLSPAEYCANPFDKEVKSLPLTLKLCESLAHAWSSLTKKPPVIVPLIKALEWVKDNKDIRTLSVYGAHHVVRAILEFACMKANKAVQQKIKGDAAGGNDVL